MTPTVRRCGPHAARGSRSPATRTSTWCGATGDTPAKCISATSTPPGTGRRGSRPPSKHADERTRTSTGLPPRRPERRASANSATSAWPHHDSVQIQPGKSNVAPLPAPMLFGMGKGSTYGSPARWLAGLALIGAMWMVAFEHDARIPGLTYVNLGLHEFGHMVTYANSDLVNALAGSIAQVAIPLAV